LRYTTLALFAVFATTGGVVFFNKKTQAAANDLIINEVYVLNNEWVEILNNGNTDVNIVNFKIKEGTGSTATYRIISSSITVPAYGLAVVNESDVGGILSFKDSGDTISLADNSNSIINSMSYASAHSASQSWQYIDGAWWALAATKGYTNLTSDTDPPVITVNPYSTGWTGSDLTVTASAVDYISGLLWINAASHTFTANGSFDFVASDNAGNFATTTITITNIDKTSPGITIAVPSANATTTSASHTVSGTAVALGGSPVSKVEVSMDRGATWQETADEAVWSIEADLLVSQGLIMVRAIDAAGNIGTAAGPVIAYEMPAVSEFSAGSTSHNSVVLSWNTPASPVLALSSFDIRYSASAITDENFSSAAAVSGAPFPATSTSQQVTVSGLNSGTGYYFGIKIIESGGSLSALATASATTSAAPRACTTNDISNSTQVSGTYPSCTALACASGYGVSGGSCVLSSSGGSVSGSNSGEGSSSSGSNASGNNRNLITSKINEAKAADGEKTNNKKTETAEEKVLGEKVVNEREEQLEQILSDAGAVFGGDVAKAAANAGKTRDTAREADGALKYTTPLVKGITGLSAEHTNAVTNFVVYGTVSSQILGAGERAGVLSSYKSTFGKLPVTQAEWEDVIKIANGRWPTERSAESEAAAATAFKKIYKRTSDRTNPHDDAAITIIAYGLRPSSRNLNSENAAIKSFRWIYGYSPKSAVAWDIVRAIAYSGATR